MTGVDQIKAELYHWIEDGDPNFLRMLHAIAKEYSIEDLTDRQKQELDQRLHKYDAGEMNFSDWETAKQRIRNDQ